MQEQKPREDSNDKKIITTTNLPRSETYWFVGAYLDDKDQTEEFVKNGFWKNRYEDRYLDEVRSIQPGDRIAIKSTYTQKNGLPFDSKGHIASVMEIKATGVVIKNKGDGRTIEVEWKKLENPRKWYFYTHVKTVWKVIPGDWASDALVDFTFRDKPQNYDKFRNAPFWRDRFGDIPEDRRQFRWTKFYEEVANKILTYRNNRTALIEGIKDIARRSNSLGNLDDRYSDGSTGPLKDICPFTTMGLFNRGIKGENRRIIAKELAGFLGVTEPIPESFEGIPVLHNLKSRLFGWQKDRQPDDIDALWEVFASAIQYADSNEQDERDLFIKAYDNANGRLCVGWNLTCGLYWIRPWVFPSLDEKARTYIEKVLKIKIERNGPKKLCNGADYYALMEELEDKFNETDCPVHSFPDLSLAAWKYKGGPLTPEDEDELQDGNDPAGNSEIKSLHKQPYSIDDIIRDGCFIERSELESYLERLETKKNIILQGPPGTGKTWLSERLAFAFTGCKDISKVLSIQFHPNLSYEDFIRGWRPGGEGKLMLMDGPFMEMIKLAKNDPDSRYVLVIEEINRGNTTQIFGEMLTLLEPDRRTPECALNLCYMNEGESRIYIPPNLYIIGTMNIADRSLALVDFALRRRFAFIELQPNFGEAWKKWLISKGGISPEIVEEIRKRMLDLNKTIEEDPSLGKPFCIGHSYVTPSNTMPISDAREWFKNIVNTEIGPLLEEYWFDSHENAEKAKQKLIENF